MNWYWVVIDLKRWAKKFLWGIYQINYMFSCTLVEMSRIKFAIVNEDGVLTCLIRFFFDYTKPILEKFVSVGTLDYPTDKVKDNSITLKILNKEGPRTCIIRVGVTLAGNRLFAMSAASKQRWSNCTWPL